MDLLIQDPEKAPRILSTSSRGQADLVGDAGDTERPWSPTDTSPGFSSSLWETGDLSPRHRDSDAPADPRPHSAQTPSVETTKL